MTQTELNEKLKELFIRFNTSPKVYLKSDYLLMLLVLKECVSKYNLPDAVDIVTQWEDVVDDNTLPSGILIKDSLDLLNQIKLDKLTATNGIMLSGSTVKLTNSLKSGESVYFGGQGSIDISGSTIHLFSTNENGNGSILLSNGVHIDTTSGNVVIGGNLSSGNSVKIGNATTTAKLLGNAISIGGSIALGSYSSGGILLLSDYGPYISITGALYFNSPYYINVYGSLGIYCTGNSIILSGSEIKINAQNAVLSGGSLVTITANNAQILSSGGTLFCSSNSATLSGSAIEIHSFSNIDLFATGTIAITGNTLDLNHAIYCSGDYINILGSAFAMSGSTTFYLPSNLHNDGSITSGDVLLYAPNGSMMKISLANLKQALENV